MNIDQALEVLNKFEYSSVEGFCKRYPDEKQYEEAMQVIHAFVNVTKTQSQDEIATLVDNLYWEDGFDSLTSEQRMKRALGVAGILY